MTEWALDSAKNGPIVFILHPCGLTVWFETVKGLRQFTSSSAVVAWNELVIMTPLSNLEEAPLVVLTGAILKEAVD